MTRFVCDRCGAVEGELGMKDWKHLSIYDMSGMLGRGNYDLCPKCADKFNRFMKNDVELWGKEAFSQIPDWAGKVLETYPPIWFKDNVPLFSPQEVKTALRIAIATMGGEK